MATSGDYRIFYIEDGTRRSHTIDPRTGHPVEDGPASATVLATTAATADAWATALLVLGEEKGFELASRHNIAALLLVRDGNGKIRERKNELWP